MVHSFFRWITARFAVLVVVFCTPVARADKPKREALVERANANRTYWRELTAVTLEIALQVPATDTGRDAVRLYIDTLTALQYAENPPVEIYDQLTKAIPELVAGYCRSEELPKHPEPCGTLMLIQVDVKRYGESPTLLPEPQTPDELQAFALREAESLVKLWHDRGEPLCAAKSPSCPRMAVLLGSAVDYFRAAHQMGRAMEIRRILVDPQYGMAGTGTAQAALCDGADALFESFLDLEEAVRWYERCAREARPFLYQSTALKKVIQLRLLLGDEPAARRAMGALEHAAGAFVYGEMERTASSIAEYSVRLGNWADADQWLEQKKSMFAAATEIDVKINYHATLARIAVARGRNEKAFAEYGVVRQLWKAAPPDVKTLDVKNLYLQQMETMLDAVGEAEFYFAKRAEKAVDEVQFPAYRGPMVEKSVNRYILEHRKIEIAKLRAIEHARDAYEKVLQIEPVAPPRWAIAAAHRVGNLWAEFAKDVENIPRLSGPIAGRTGITYEDLRQSYAALVGPSPWPNNAKEAFKVCVERAIRSKYFDENARQCAAALGRYESRSPVVVEELHDAPGHSYFGVPARPILDVKH